MTTSDRLLQPETLAAQGGERTAEPYWDIVPPLHPSTTFERAGDGSYPGGRLYSRDASPAYLPAERLLSELEGGRAAALFSSGMAAASAVLLALSAGARVLAPQDMYWGLRNWLILFAADWKLDLVFYEDLPSMAEQLAAPADLVWVETPANPTWDVIDIAAAAQLAHDAGARLVVDSTVATPVLTRPLALGADIVMHSATKYLNGHSDVVAGVLVTGVEDGFWQRVKTVRASAGSVLGPFEAWLLLRGMRTLYPRVRLATASAAQIAAHFEGHPQVLSVLYPGLASHPGHQVARSQMHGGFGGMLSLRVRGGEAAAREVAARLKVFRRATSLGSVESLVEHRASVEGPGTRCPDDLLRLSVGMEHVQDLIADLDAALSTPAS